MKTRCSLTSHGTPIAARFTLVTPDRRLLFARVAGILAAWGMNIITADAFSNAHGIVVDTFRFTDSFKDAGDESARARTPG